MTLLFECPKCGFKTKDVTIEYETYDLEFDGPDNWLCVVALEVTCPRCKEAYAVKGDCIG